MTGGNDGYLTMFDYALGEVVHQFKAHDGMPVTF